MTDRPDDLDAIDELASAILDGEATPEQLARAGEPAVLARLAEFRVVAAVVGRAVGPVSAEGRAATITAALSAWGTEDPALTEREDALATRRRAVAARRWLPAVAAVAVVAVAAGIFAIGSTTDSHQQAASPSEATTLESSDAATGSGGATGGDSFGSSRMAITELGGFSNLDDLLAAVEGQFAIGQTAAGTVADNGQPATTTAASGQAGGGAPPVAATSESLCAPDPAGESPFATASATLDGEPVFVVVTSRPDGATHIRVFRQVDCSVLADAVTSSSG